MADTVEQVKARLSIVDVVSQYVQLQRAGAVFKARCPFHNERTPSFVVSPERGTYHCFGCNVGGDIFTFVQEIEGLDFKGALKVLAERAGVEIVYQEREKKDEKDRLRSLLEEATLFYQTQLTEKHPAYEYLKKRGLTRETIALFRIGFAPDEWRSVSPHLKQRGYSEKEMEAAGLVKRSEKGIYDRFRSRIMFPINDSAGRVVAFSGRIFGEAKEDVAKYINSPETSLYHKGSILFGYDRAKLAIRKHDFSILVEGQMDLIAVHQAGWPNTVAVSGTALTTEHIALLRRMSENVVLALDADEAGIRASEKSAREALAAGMDVKVARISSGKDPADLLQNEGGKEVWRGAIRESVHIVTFLLDTLEKASKDARAFARAVERTVVPFVAVIPSAIDQSHFVRMVAGRINVSEDSVRAAMRGITLSTQTEAAAEKSAPQYTRAELLYGHLLLLGQNNDDHIAHAIREALGAGIHQLDALAEKQKEALVFLAEEDGGRVRDLQEHRRALARFVTRDRLQRELEEASQALRHAEAARDSQEIERLVRLCTELSSTLAKIAVSR